MLVITKENLFDSKSQAIVNTVNCVKVMGKGLALEFKKRYPLMFEDYKKIDLKIGMVHVWKVENSPYIINFPTKLHWRNPSQYIYIEKGLVALDKAIKEFDIKSIAIPALGCSLGGLDFAVVKSMIEKFHDKNWGKIEVFLHSIVHWKDLSSR